MAEISKKPHTIDSQSSPPWSATTKAIVASAALILMAIVAWRFRSLWSSVVIAVLLAYLLNPLVNLSMNRLKLRRGTAVLLVYLVLLVVVGGGMVTLGFIAAEQISRLITLTQELDVVDITQRLQEQIPELIGYEFTIGAYTIQVSDALEFLNFDSLAGQAISLVQSTFSLSGAMVAQAAQTTVNTLALLALVLILSVYIARDFPRFGRLISDLAHQSGYRSDAERLIDETIRIWNSYLRGQVILALLIGVVVTIVLFLLGVTNPLALGILSGVMEFLPVVGPLFGAGVAVIVAFFQTEPGLGLSSLYFAGVVLAAMFIIQQIENNLLVPRIVGDALDLHPLVVMISVLMGTSLAGLLGAVLAAPVVATLKLLSAYGWRKMLDLEPFPNAEATPPKTIETTKQQKVQKGTQRKRRRRRRKK